MKPFHITESLFSEPPKNSNYYLVAIDGRGGSGKSTVFKYLQTILPDCTFINGDDYFEPVEAEDVWGDFNDERFKTDVIAPLKNGQASLTYRPYDWAHEPHVVSRKITVGKAVLLERIYSFNFDVAWDLRLWVETPKELCFERGIARDKAEAERAVRAWQRWQREEDAYIADFQPQMQADFILRGDVPFSEQILL